MGCTDYNNRLEIVQGDDKTFYGSVVSADVADWSLWDGYFQAKRYISDSTFIIDTSVACTDSSMWVFTVPGSVTINIDKCEDAIYQFYIQEQSSSEIKTIAQDRLSIINAVRV